MWWGTGTSCSVKLQMSSAWKCSRSVWMRLWTIWSSGRCSCLCQVPSDPTHSILYSIDSVILWVFFFLAQRTSNTKIPASPKELNNYARSIYIKILNPLFLHVSCCTNTQCCSENKFIGSLYRVALTLGIQPLRKDSQSPKWCHKSFLQGSLQWPIHQTVVLMNSCDLVVFSVWCSKQPLGVCAVMISFCTFLTRFHTYLLWFLYFDISQNCPSHLTAPCIKNLQILLVYFT